MNSTSVPTLLGVFSSLFAIWAIHIFLVVDDCADHGGTFINDIGKCVLENGQYYESTLAAVAIVMYFIVGFTVSFIVSTLIRKLFKIEKKV
ncbi:MAG: hypothetical protein GY787_27350 [Alteromonadales bacterium]|nr:hypothetical protein [Alteromonadales bacterium]MCP4988129.1 hypothetical protein [Colwellia sp.]